MRFSHQTHTHTHTHCLAPLHNIIARYYEDKSSGAWKPGKKGVALNLHEWHQLKKHAEQASASLEQQQLSKIELGES